MKKGKTNKKISIETEVQATELLVEDLDNSSEIIQEE